MLMCLLQGVAMVCGFLVTAALVVAAFFSHKTRGKIWRYGKPNIYWEQPPETGGLVSEGRDVKDWVRKTHTGMNIMFILLIDGFYLPVKKQQHIHSTYIEKI